MADGAALHIGNVKETTMAHDHATAAHGAGDGHNHAAGANSKMLAIALGLTTAFLIAEVIGAYVFNSLALLSDAAHMFTDAAALAIALAAIRIGQRKPDDSRTFGYRRFEILAAAFNALLLFAVAGYVLWEGVARFFDPAPVESTGMLIVAAIGLVVNIIAMRLLASGKDNSLNMKGAYLEVWADMLGSLGVIVGALVIMFTGWTGSIRWSPSASGCGCCRAPGYCCATRPTSCWRACRAA